MSFKDDLEADINDTFLSEDEFAGQHCIDGVDMSASVIKKGYERRRHSSRSHEDVIYNKRIILFVAGSDFGALPAVNRPLTLDGKQYLVKAADDECGMYKIILEVT